MEKDDRQSVFSLLGGAKLCKFPVGAHKKPGSSHVASILPKRVTHQARTPVARVYGEVQQESKLRARGLGFEGTFQVRR